MKAYVLVKAGAADKAFELRDIPQTQPGDGQVGVEVEAFGLNYADIMARKGLYRDCPPLPTVIGYEVVGRVRSIGKGVSHVAPGDRVVAFTRFGGYSQWVVSVGDGVVKIPETMDVGTATALATQYSTAWFSAEYQTRLHPGEHVLVQAAAGGVGTALVQIAKMRGCVVYGTAGSDAKLQYLRDLGVDYPINYNTQDFVAEIQKIRGKAGLDVVFDSLGGKIFKQGYKLLGNGGRIVGFGAASRSSGKGGIFGDIGLLFGFGFYNPAFMLMQCKTIIGVNMLRIADERPAALGVCMAEVVKHLESGHLSPITGKVFPASELAAAHQYVESRQSVGKVVCQW